MKQTDAGSEHPSGPRALRVAFDTFGCRSNQADTLELQASTEEAGAETCASDAGADVYVVNTCTVTDEADRAAYRQLRKIRRHSPHARIVVTGCGAESNREGFERLGVVDTICGPGRRGELVRAILSGDMKHGEAPVSRMQAGTHRRKVPFLSAPLTEPLSEKVPGPGGLLGELPTKTRFHLRVQEGCENSCTFCIIPQSRGGLVSRPLALILEDLERLFNLGYQEVVLTGTHLGGYGEDCGTSLAKLCAELSEKSPIPRLRLSSLDPNDVSVELIDILAESHTFCRHLHICVQAFSDSVLKRMARRYRLSEVCEILLHLEKRMPDMCLGTDLIAGFPGESRQDVEQAIRFFSNQDFLGLPFSYLHVFPYSERSGTPATLLDGVVPVPERKRRAARWRALSETRWRNFLSSLIGRELEMIVEGGADENELVGTSREFAQLRVDMSKRSTMKNDFKKGDRITVWGRRVDDVEGKLVCDF